MFTRIPKTNVGTAESIDELRRAVEISINRLIDAINNSSIVEELDMRSHRVVNVARPASATDAVNVAYLRDQLAQLKTRITGASISASSVGISAGSGITLSEITLADVTTEITATAPINAGDILCIRLTQDATGGREITWGTTFVGPTTDISGDADSSSVFMFVGMSDGNWWLAAAPAIGV